MRFSIQREALLKPPAAGGGRSGASADLPVLANLLVSVGNGQVALTGTDLEVEMVAGAEVQDGAGETTIPARKLFDIIRALPDGAHRVEACG